MVLSTPDGFVYDMRAVSDIYRDERARRLIDIVSDEEYYRWMLMQRSPKREPYPASLVWAE